MSSIVPNAPPQSGKPTSALMWSVANMLVGRFGTMAIGVALARVLGPHEFGTYAVALVVLVALLSFNELGVSLAIVRWPSDPSGIAPTVATLSLLTSVVLAGAAYLGAPAFATAMGDPHATGPVRWMVLCVIVSGAVSTPVALLQRYFHQGRRTLADQANVWVGAAVSLVLAVAGIGAMALVVGRLAGCLISGAILVKYSPLPFRFGWDRAQLRSLLGFGLPLAGASILVFVIGYIDQVLVSSALGTVVLGYYVLAVNLAGWPVSLFSLPLRNVAPAVFSRMQHDPETMSQSFFSVARLLAAIAIPACCLLAATAEPVVRLVYGREWEPAATILAWLAIFAAFRIMFELLYDFLVVVRAAGGILITQMLTLCTLVPAVALGTAHWGAPGAAMGQVVVGAAVVGPLYLYLLTRSGVSAAHYLAGLALPCLGGAVAGFGSALILRAGWGDLASVALCSLLTLAAMMVLCYRHRGDIHLLRNGRATRLSEALAA